MRAEIIAVGTELLLGEVVNTNAAFLARELAALGISCHFRQVVGDNPARLREALEIALSRSELVITTGGLGPTKDDLTKESIAAALGVPLEFHEPSWEHLVSRLAARGRLPEPSHRREAMMPVGATVFPNPQGTANALAVSVPKVSTDVLPALLNQRNGEQVPVVEDAAGDRFRRLSSQHSGRPSKPSESANIDQTIVMLPGPPHEMSATFTEEVAPFLSAKSSGTLVSHNLHFFGIGESQLESQLPPGWLDNENPTTAIYAGAGEVRVRISARAETALDAENLIEPLIADLQELFPEYLYGVDADLPTTLVTLLKEKGLTIATAESCTGGRIAASITGVPGSSAVFGYGVVSYANSAKMELLGVRADTLALYGAVSEETAIEMAEGIKNLSGADIGIGITGIAGPDGGSTEKPVGLVWVGIASQLGIVTKQLNLARGLNDQRHLIQEMATSHALNLARQAAQRVSV